MSKKCTTLLQKLRTFSVHFSKARLRAINTERVRRNRQRRKLKDAVADFVNRLHLYDDNEDD